MAEPEQLVIFNGVRVVSYWPDRVRAAQEVTAYEIGGKSYPRIPYGDEPDDWGAETQPCHDCAVIKGQFHVEGCDVEACPKCKGQSISCECSDGEPPDGEFDFQAHREKALSA
jgi:hypothetical protein